MQVKQVLRNDRLDQQLRDRGYAIFDFLAAEEVDHVQKEFDRLHDFEIPNTELFGSHRRHDPVYQMAVKQLLLETIQPKLETFLNGCRIIEPVFNVKMPGVGVFDFHQDWSLVDIVEDSCYTVWIPMLDVNRHNGTISVLEGSHLYRRSFRSCMVPPIYDYQDEELRNLIEENRTIFDMKKGQAIIFDGNIIHSTEANRSDDMRCAMIFGVARKTSPLLFHYLDKENNRVEEYEIDSEFFYVYDYQSRPSQHARFRQSYPYDQKPVNADEMKSLVREYTSA